MAFNFQEIADVASIRKNSRETIRVRRVRINGADCIDLRSFFQRKQSDLELTPTGKGLCVSHFVALELYTALADALKQSEDTDTTGAADASDNEPMEVEYADPEPDAPEDYVPRMVHDRTPAPVDDLDPNEDEPF